MGLREDAIAAATAQDAADAEALQLKLADLKNRSHDALSSFGIRESHGMQMVDYRLTADTNGFFTSIWQDSVDDIHLGVRVNTSTGETQIALVVDDATKPGFPWKIIPPVVDSLAGLGNVLEAQP